MRLRPSAISPRWLPKAVADGTDIKAREHVAFANTMAGFVMTTTRLTSHHAMEHALSAFHPELPHGAGLIMLSMAYFGHMVAVGAQSGTLRRARRGHGRRGRRAALRLPERARVSSTTAACRT